MKYKYQICIVFVCLVSLIISGSFSARASSLDNSESTELTTEQNSVESETFNDNTEGNTTEENTTEISATETETTTSMEEISLEENTTEIQTTDNTKDFTKIEEQKVEEVNEVMQAISDMNMVSGKYYFFQKYLYDCNAVYLEKYIAHLQLQISACEQVYQMGNTTEAVLESYKAQKALAEAELTVAKNESEYNNLYLTKNELDYSDIDMKEIRTVESVDYYIENYPEVDYMKLARYVTDCNNAIAGIQAKKVEINALETDVTMAGLLLEVGEISQLEYSEKEITLAKAQFELEQQYVAMNVGYWQLMMLCE